MDRAATLEQLAQLCRSDRDGSAPRTIHPTGTAQLDEALPGGGWQSGTIVELMPATTGIGELRVLMPALASITHGDRYVALIAPPFIPYAPALSRQRVQPERLLVIQAKLPEDILWASEQTLRCSSFGAVLAWPAMIRDRDIRRLQLAAEAGRSVGFLYRPTAAALEASPAAVRLKLRAGKDGLHIDILKCRGTRGGMQVLTERRRSPS